METDYKDIAYVYMPYHSFPAKEYITHIVETGDLTATDVLKHSSALDQLVERLNEKGLSEKDITQEMLLEYVKAQDEEKLQSMMPYTQMMITTNQSDVLSLESKLADAVDDNYAVFIDQSSILGLKVFADELNQHDQFSYVFAMIFILMQYVMGHSNIAVTMDVV